MDESVIRGYTYAHPSAVQYPAPPPTAAHGQAMYRSPYVYTAPYPPQQGAQAAPTQAAQAPPARAPPTAPYAAPQPSGAYLSQTRHMVRPGGTPPPLTCCSRVARSTLNTCNRPTIVASRTRSPFMCVSVL